MQLELECFAVQSGTAQETSTKEQSSGAVLALASPQAIGHSTFSHRANAVGALLLTHSPCLQGDVGVGMEKTQNQAQGIRMRTSLPSNRCECTVPAYTQWLQSHNHACPGTGKMQHHSREVSSFGHVFASFQQPELVTPTTPQLWTHSTNSLASRGSCVCRERQDEASRRKAVELYKVLQRIMQEEHGFDNDQNAMVLRVLSDTLESLQQYGEPLCRLVA